MLEGEITVTSVLNDITTFTVILPELSIEQATEGDEFFGNASVTVIENVSRKMEETSSVPEIVIPEYDKNKQTIMIIDDDSAMLWFVTEIFIDKYNVIPINNSTEVMSCLEQSSPDIIISDIMMPDIDGISLTTLIKGDKLRKHIPMILLSAKNTVEDQVRGIDSGAEVYITKPFSATYLKARVKNLLAQRQKLQALYRQDLMPAGVAAPVPASGEQNDENITDVPEADKAPVMSPNDRKFMDKLVELMEKNMDNGDLVVDDFVRELAVSRSVFFKKLKTLTGLAPIEFIKEMRINRAVQLIETGEYSMTQISYMVGINDPRYFSKCFKQKMGMTPTEYRDKSLR